MNKRERVLNSLSGLPVDRLPYTFSKHFPADFTHGEIGVKNHIDFYNQTGVDIMKIMNEQLMPYIGKIERPEDWLQVRQFSKNSSFITLQLDLVKRIMEELGPEHYYLVTVHGLIASTIHVSLRQLGFYDARRLHAEHLRQKPQVMKDAHAYMAELLSHLTAGCSVLGADGIYFASLGGDDEYLTDEEFADAIKPYEISLLKQAREEFRLTNFLHMCKDRLQIARYLDYAEYADVVNWGIHENRISLSDGVRLFPGKTIMGGFNNQDKDLLSGNRPGILDKTRAIVAEMSQVSSFIVGADCTLPTQIDNASLRMVADALQA